MLTREKIIEALERIPFFRSLEDEVREKLLPYAELRVLKAGERLWFEGQNSERFSFVARGRVKLVKNAYGGRDTILEMPAQGDLLCASAVCSFVPYCCSSESMEDDTEVVLLPRRDVLALVEQKPNVARAFVREVTCRAIHLCQRVEELSGGQVEQRIALLLLKLADRMGRADENGLIRIRIPLTRQDIADLCGTTVETTIRIMSRFKKKQIVDKITRGFLITDRKELELISKGVHKTGHPPLPTVD